MQEIARQRKDALVDFQFVASDDLFLSDIWLLLKNMPYPWLSNFQSSRVYRVVDLSAGNVFQVC